MELEKVSPIYLACAANNDYAMPLAVTVRSVLDNFKGKSRIKLYILDGGIQPSSKRRIAQSIASDQIEITWAKPSEAMLQGLPVSEKYPLPIYYRLLLPQILPVNATKAIYLDTDLVVQGDLQTLWDTEIDDNYVLAVQDGCQRCIGMAGGLKKHKEYGISPDLKYFNTGVLVINLKKWRTDNIFEKAIAFLHQNAEYAFNPDQDALNAVLAGQWGELNPRWNQIHAVHEWAGWQESPYDEALYDQVLRSPYIIHYTTPPKPWQKGCKHPESSLFFDYLDRTAWSGWRNTLWRRIGRRLLKEIKQVSRVQQFA